MFSYIISRFSFGGIKILFLTGDTHAYFDEREKFFDKLTSEDILIILGDFGFSWNLKTEKEWNDKNYPFITLSILGNHENYERIYKDYPIVEVFGGKVYQFNKNTYYLINGDMYEIEGKKFFNFGGALSIDKHLRMPYLSWWPEEIPSGKDYENAITHLVNNNWTFDYFITHTGSTDEIAEMFGLDRIIEDRTQNMITSLMYEIKSHEGKFSKHFFGHMHCHMERTGDNFKSICMYDDIYDLRGDKYINSMLL